MSRRREAGGTTSNEGTGRVKNTFSPELKCAYHPKQTITNFCKCEECLLPVCPACINVHTEEHKLNKSSPRFEEYLLPHPGSAE